MTDTPLRPLLAEIARPTIVNVGATPRINAVVGAAEIRKEMVDLDTRHLEDFVCINKLCDLASLGGKECHGHHVVAYAGRETKRIVSGQRRCFCFDNLSCLCMPSQL